ncbi:MAG TPA: hypothetical protein VFR67_21765 [Pilimelia sp.]|nr:hypothetical protein [Pilimelia sp.]
MTYPNPNLPDPYQQPYSPPSSGAPYAPGTPGTPYSPAPLVPAAAPYSPGPLMPAASPYGPAPYGVDPVTGLPLSDKSKVIAGLLQLLPAFALALGGIGRLYAGHTSLGVVQLVMTVVGWVSFWCGFLLVVPFLIFFGVWLWFVIDGVILLAGRSTDGQGRLLRT